MATVNEPFFPQHLRDEIRRLRPEDYLLAREHLSGNERKPRLVVLRDLGRVGDEMHRMATQTSTLLNSPPYDYRFEWEWIIWDEHHIFTRTQFRALRSQLNIGLFVGETVTDDCVRVGLGFLLRAEEDALGLQDWGDFWALVSENPRRFDETFSLERGGLGYAEPESLLPLSAEAVLRDQPHEADDWRFYGRLFRWGNSADDEILADRRRFVIEAHNIFQRIRDAGFGRSA